MRRGQLTAGARVLASTSFFFVFSTEALRAADLTTGPVTPSLAPAQKSLRWFVQFGILGSISQSTSRLYAQPVVGAFGVGPQFLLPGRGESFSDLFTVSFQAGFFLTPSWSVELSGGVPTWQTAKITGFSATAPVAGTVLSKTMPGSLPITIAYHFTQFGALQPYAGGGVSAVFAFAQRNGFTTGNATEPSIALVLQGGFDYMFSQNWGAFFDAKKFFDRSIGTATGLNFGPTLGLAHLSATSVTNSQPWVLSTGLTYRF